MDSEPSGCLRALVLPVIAGDMGGLSESGGGCLFLLVLPLAALTCSCAQRLGRLGRLRRRPYNPPEAGLPRGYPPPPQAAWRASLAMPSSYAPLSCAKSE